MADISNKVLADIREYLEEIEKQVKKVYGVIADIEAAKAQSYREIPGIEGVFDGVAMTAENGEKYDVPANYAAKSRLVFGDTLKKIEEDGKTLYKQIVKVPRKKIEGILNKKEGKWYILTDAGSYRISDVAAEFNSAQANDEAIAFIPEADVNAPYAALDKIVTQRIPVRLMPPVEATGVSKESVAKPKTVSDKPKKKSSKKAEAPKDKEFVSNLGGQTAPAATKAQPQQTIATLKDIDDDDLR